jgi:hypothetical protein
MNPAEFLGLIDRVGFVLLVVAAALAVIYTLAAWWNGWRWWKPMQPDHKEVEKWQERHPWKGGE